jgi:hypothetical protein
MGIRAYQWDAFQVPSAAIKSKNGKNKIAGLKDTGIKNKALFFFFRPVSPFAGLLF